MKLSGKVALITGAGSGIGKAAALLFAKEGAAVAAVSRTAGEIEAVAEQIRQAGGKAIAPPADISQEDQVKGAVDSVMDAWGRLDIVFANAGINGVWAPLEEITVQEYEQTMDINVKGTFLTLKHTAPLLKRQGGSVIVTSSINGTRVFSNTGATVYSCSKAAQVAMAKMLALELARHKVRVNVICPGWIRTEIGENTQARNLSRIRYGITVEGGAIPLTGGKPGTAQQVAQLALFLASDDSSHISGTEMWIDGAESLLRG